MSSNAMDLDHTATHSRRTATAYDVPTMSHVAHRKLAQLLADGHRVCGVMFERRNNDGTVDLGAVSVDGTLIRWPAASGGTP